MQRVETITSLDVGAVGWESKSMASATTQIGYGRLVEVVRGLLNGLADVRAEGAEQAREIGKLKEKAETFQTKIETLQELSDLQDSEVADHDRRLTELTKEIEVLKADFSAQKKALTSSLHGAKVREGFAKARADRLEAGLARTQTSSPKLRSPAKRDATSKAKRDSKSKR